MDNNEHKMKRGLKSRHMQMIALGASVGTGLFYGSAPTIKLVEYWYYFILFISRDFYFLCHENVG